MTPQRCFILEKDACADLINQINLCMVKTQGEKTEDEEKKHKIQMGIKQGKNQGKLIIDATCASADISYP